MERHEEFTRLWTEAQPVVAAYIRALVRDFQEAEDLLQEVAVILLRKFPEYDAERAFVAWGIGIAKREVLMARRRHARDFLCCETDLLERISDTYAELAPELEARFRALSDCLQLVKGRKIELLRLRYEEALKPESIAQRIGIGVATVRVILSKTRASLRHCIERKLRREQFQS